MAINDSSWISMEIEVHGSERIIHKINGQEVIEYCKSQYEGSDEFASEVFEKDHSRIISKAILRFRLKAIQKNLEI